MSAVIATPNASVALCPSVEAQLLHSAACSVKAFIRTSNDVVGSNNGTGKLLTSNLRSNFAHLMTSKTNMLPSIETFVSSVTRTLGASVAVLVTALIYVERLSKRLPQKAIGKADTPYRIFLGTLLLADKYWSDRAIKVRALVTATGGLFRHCEILAMERAMLGLLGYKLFVSAENIRNFAKNLGINIDATLASTAIKSKTVTVE
ncbi:hypothetical protein COEREDRAFT_80368 [Coemansia reversa NRRL 1564]|uniref:Cyclin N-terminal domain-containing protein n=1 Tax=Coemansia reversa (strain ATCC 12441 / NRRL 1564) TaxID=763665 RepID=A0A2G5BF86_COERN|nr:hypothetical protein COEREDRAFT_80368 [Coemansia reversa NRRL 1564]|eukprot:PIA17688.1 hypothetical protein COEREDRAFT_80368 [Coemansia reversa NRRL 1564]